MTYIDPTTPQLELIDRLFQAYSTRDISNVTPFLSKNFVYTTFPKIADMPDQTMKNHIEVFGPMFARMAKLDYIFHEVIEAPGKVVAQWTALCTHPGTPTFEHDSVSIFTLAEEDGELKVLEFKDFMDTEKCDLRKATSAEGQIA